MDEITQVKIQFRKEQWSKLIRECQDSGMTVRNWCKQKSINEASYYYWLKKIRKEACKQRLSITHVDQKPVEFAKLSFDTRPTQTLGFITIHFPIATVEVKEGTSKETLETVLLALKSIC
ncbi:hypothetical protein BHU72_09920 [Desulfuribacillus stibiiarsenatis]|uniref:Transposase n=1 Tax=Desulfuribacillus stibiiarsenatis TaxID=1390249 RepID=A0A1E5L312_9FIRM|nr:hypothetical protein [Desulfuribacillus stibiiarsenatis]OEH84512.1 hypothetical protein BHU72_09920 [Desulfuribacillus stibiiarsenatis]